MRGPAAREPRAGESITAEEVAALRAQLASEQASVRRLAAQLEEAHQGLAAARAAADDHDALARERDAAIAARDEARANANLDHDAVIEERDQAVHERAAALYARDEALDERAAANFERKNAIAERDAAFAERDRAIEAHRAAVRDLEALEQRVAGAEQARLEEIASAPPAGAVRATPGEDRDDPPATRDRLGPARRRPHRPRRVGDRRLQGPARPRLERGAAAARRHAPTPSRCARSTRATSAWTGSRSSSGASSSSTSAPSHIGQTAAGSIVARRASLVPPAAARGADQHRRGP